MQICDIISPIFRVLKESPRWLVEKGRISEAESILRRGAQLNGKSYNIPDDLYEILQEIYLKEVDIIRFINIHICSLVSFQIHL